MTDLFTAMPTGRCRLSLRRFRHDAEQHFHEAMVTVDEDAPSPCTAEGYRSVPDDLIPHDDPRWPAACACGEMFTAADVWQCTGQDWHEGGTVRFAWGLGSWEAPPGAMIRTPWRDQDGRPGSWLVFLPNGAGWNTNDRAWDGNAWGLYWDVSGTPPLITVSPSINDCGSRPWHGWIRDGNFVTA
jgi:hypothetical protein